MLEEPNQSGMTCNGNHDDLQKQIGDIRVDVAALKAMLKMALIGNPIAAALITGLAMFAVTHR